MSRLIHPKQRWTSDACGWRRREEETEQRERREGGEEEDEGRDVRRGEEGGVRLGEGVETLAKAADARVSIP